MSEEKMGGGDVVKFADYLKRKAIRDAQPKPEAQEDKVPPLTGVQAIQESQRIVGRFPSFASLAKDIERQQGIKSKTPHENSIKRARLDYANELRMARGLRSDKLGDMVRKLFAEYDSRQTVFPNTQYVAYARAYLEKHAPDCILPDMG